MNWEVEMNWIGALSLFFLCTSQAVGFAEEAGQRWRLFEGTTHSAVSTDLRHGHDFKETFLLDTSTGETFIFNRDSGFVHLRRAE